MIACTKIPFTKRDALAAVKRARKSHDQRRKECRTYYCNVCKSWHLTSQTKGENVVMDAPVKFKKLWKKLLKQSA